jgi:crotonobetainyl-CoA:carnitine CoA-transferase CaiB-like acyl-CoA transferase
MAGRVENSDALDECVNGWTADHTPEQVMTMMQAAGVAAGVVATAEDSEKDPQLAAYDFFHEMEHPYLGKQKFFHPPGFTLSATPAELHLPVRLGEHTGYICKDILGIPAADFDRMEREGVFD